MKGGNGSFSYENLSRLFKFKRKFTNRNEFKTGNRKFAFEKHVSVNLIMRIISMKGKNWGVMTYLFEERPCPSLKILISLSKEGIKRLFQTEIGNGIRHVYDSGNIWQSDEGIVFTIGLFKKVCIFKNISTFLNHSNRFFNINRHCNFAKILSNIVFKKLPKTEFNFWIPFGWQGRPFLICVKRWVFKKRRVSWDKWINPCVNIDSGNKGGGYYFRLVSCVMHALKSVINNNFIIYRKTLKRAISLCKEGVTHLLENLFLY